MEGVYGKHPPVLSVLVIDMTWTNVRPRKTRQQLLCPNRKIYYLTTTAVAIASLVCF